MFLFSASLRRRLPRPSQVRFTPLKSTMPATAPMSTSWPVAQSSKDNGSNFTTGKDDRALPAPGDGEPIKLDVSGDGTTVKLGTLGPLVVNRDGTMGRIGNWAEMTEIERQSTIRILGKRNQQRLAALREAKSQSQEGQESKNEGGNSGDSAKQ